MYKPRRGDRSLGTVSVAPPGLRIRTPSGVPRPRSCEEIVCHSERSEESAFIFLKTNNCRFFASLRMTGLDDFFTPSRYSFLPALARHNPADVLQEDEQVHGVGGRIGEFEFLVETSGALARRGLFSRQRSASRRWISPRGAPGPNRRQAACASGAPSSARMPFRYVEPCRGWGNSPSCSRQNTTSGRTVW